MKKTSRPTSLDRRIDHLRRTGVLSLASSNTKDGIKPLAKKPGALRRFLKSRED